MNYDPNPSPYVDVREIILERMKVAARQYLSPQLAHEARASVEFDHMADAMAIDLRTYVLRERLLTDDQSADYSRTVIVRQSAPRYVRSLAVVTLLAVVLGAITATLAPFIISAALALAAVAIHASNPPVTHERTVSGTVTIPVTSYATYPDNTTVLPAEKWGSPVRLQEASTPRWFEA